MGFQDRSYLGNLDAFRDWGHARDYVQMQRLLLQQQEPRDYVIASGGQHSVREFVEVAADYLGMRVRWTGSGRETQGWDQNGNLIVSVDPRYFRPTEVEYLLGDASKAHRELGRNPRTSFKELVKEMVEEGFKTAQRDALIQHGYSPFNYHEN